MKLPSFQFYPGDWMKDPALRSVGYAARGLWADMLCLMHESVRRGYLQHETGKPVTTEQIARMTGGSLGEVSQLLQELEDSGVFSRSEHGTIYSRRIVREEQVRKKQIEYGKQGGNPALMGGVKGGDKVKANPKITPSVSSSSSVSSAKEKTDGRAPKVFTKPTAAEVTAYAKTIGYTLNGADFVNKYESIGWVVGKNRTPMKDWQAVVRTWKGNEASTPAAKADDAAQIRKEGWIRAGLSPCHGKPWENRETNEGPKSVCSYCGVSR